MGSHRAFEQPRAAASIRRRRLAFTAACWLLTLASTPGLAAGHWEAVHSMGGKPLRYMCVRPSTEGGFLLAGYSGFFNGGTYGGVLARIAVDGALLWEESVGGSSDDNLFVIRELAEGRWVAAGTTASFGSGGNDAWVLELDSHGQILWQMTYGGPGDESVNDIQPVSGGGFVLAGETTSADGYLDAWCARLDADGGILWQRTVGGPNHDRAYAVRELRNGDFVVAAETYSFGAGHGDAWVLLLSASGDIVWQRTLGGAGDDDAGQVEVINDREFLVGGYTDSFGAGNGDAWIARMDIDGHFLWKKAFGGAGTDLLYEIHRTAAGHILACGATDSFGLSDFGGWLFELSANGRLLWNRLHEGIEHAWLYSASETRDGDIVMTGQTWTDAGNDIPSFVAVAGPGGEISTDCPSTQPQSPLVVRDLPATITVPRAASRPAPMITLSARAKTRAPAINPTVACRDTAR